MLYHPRRHWTLASFVPRPSSQHARALGIRFVEQERPTPVTLVLAGSPGSGKTHLLHALVQVGVATAACEDRDLVAAGRLIPIHRHRTPRAA